MPIEPHYSHTLVVQPGNLDWSALERLEGWLLSQEPGLDECFVTVIEFTGEFTAASVSEARRHVEEQQLRIKRVGVTVGRLQPPPLVAAHLSWTAGIDRTGVHISGRNQTLVEELGSRLEGELASGLLDE